MGVLDKLEDIPMSLIYSIVLLSVLVPLIYPLGLPLSVDKTTKAAYDLIESLPEGSYILWDYDIGPTSYAESGDASIAMIKHIFKKNLKPVFVSSHTDGIIFIESDVPPIAEKYGKEYGIDYVNLGYFAGLEIGITAVLNDISSIYSTDFHNIPIEDLEIFQTVKNHEQISLVIYAGGFDPGQWVRQANTAYGIDIIIVPGAIIIPTLTPYFPDQIGGIVGSLRGGAEYELLISELGLAIRGMDSLSLSFFLIVVIGILGNLKRIITSLTWRSE